MAALIALATWVASDAGPVEVVERGAELVRTRQHVAELADMIDGEELARRVAGVHYAQMSAAQRRALSGAVERYAHAAFDRHAGKVGAFALSCAEHARQSAFAEVRCALERDGERTEITFLLRHTDRWRVFDVHTPDTLLVRDNARRADERIRAAGIDDYIERLRAGADASRFEAPLAGAKGSEP